MLRYNLMDKYFLAVITLIIFSILAVLYVRLSNKGVFLSKEEDKAKEGDNFTFLE